MKSLRDEICLTAGDKGGFNFILGGTPKISSELAGFHRATHDFISFRVYSRIRTGEMLFLI